MSQEHALLHSQNAVVRYGALQARQDTMGPASPETKLCFADSASTAQVQCMSTDAPLLKQQAAFMQMPRAKPSTKLSIHCKDCTGALACARGMPLRGPGASNACLHACQALQGSNKHMGSLALTYFPSWAIKGCCSPAFPISLPCTPIVQRCRRTGVASASSKRRRLTSRSHCSSFLRRSGSRALTLAARRKSFSAFLTLPKPRLASARR